MVTFTATSTAEYYRESWITLRIIMCMPYMCVSALFQVYLGCKLFPSLVEALKGLKEENKLSLQNSIFLLVFWMND